MAIYPLKWNRPYPRSLLLSREIVLQDCPWARRVAILEASTVTLGRPILLPLALAFLMPARTRSAIRLRSSSATAPRTVKTIFPVGVLVSICSDRETKSIPRALYVSRT